MTDLIKIELERRKRDLTESERLYQEIEGKNLQLYCVWERYGGNQSIIALKKGVRGIDKDGLLELLPDDLECIEKAFGAGAAKQVSDYDRLIRPLRDGAEIKAINSTVLKEVLEKGVCYHFYLKQDDSETSPMEI